MTALYLLTMSTVLFTIGLLGLYINKKNILLSLMSIELIFLSLSLSFLAYSFLLNDFNGHLFALSILACAGAESAILLALILNFFRAAGNISILALNQLKG